MKLKHAIILAFVMVVTIPMLFTLNMVIRDYSVSQYHLQMESHLLSLSQIAKRRIQASIDRVRDNTALLDSRTQLRTSLKAWNESKLPEHLQKVQRSITDAKIGMDGILSATLFDPAGVPIASTKPVVAPELLTVFPETNVQMMLEEGEVPFMRTVSRLILDADLVGYLKVDFSVGFIHDLVNDRSGLGSTGEWLFAVRDENGHAMFVFPLKYDQDAAFKRRVKKEQLRVPVTQALLGNEAFLPDAIDYRGEPVIAATRYLPELDWGLVAKIDKAEVSQFTDQMQLFLAWLTLAAIVVAIGIGFILAYYIARPVELLKENSDRLAEGDFDIKPHNSGWFEVKQLSQSFSTMATAIKDLSDNLNNKVEERTAELDEANRKLMEIATRDHLTELYNRRFLVERLEEEFSRARRHEYNLAVVLIDIDHFKQVNDTWGHEAGDVILQAVSALLQQNVRASDIVARYGGEEFCMILPLVGKDDALALLERIRLDIEALNQPYDGNKISVTASAGIAMLNPLVKTYNGLLKRADLALYKAKDQGRNQVVFHVEEAGDGNVFQLPS